MIYGELMRFKKMRLPGFPECIAPGVRMQRAVVPGFPAPGYREVWGTRAMGTCEQTYKIRIELRGGQLLGNSENDSPRRNR